MAESLEVLLPVTADLECELSGKGQTSGEDVAVCSQFLSQGI